MNIQKRRKSHLASIQSARSLAGVFVFVGFVMLTITAGAAALLFQTDIMGSSTESLLEALTPVVEREEAAQDAGSAGSLKFVDAVEKAKSLLRFMITTLDWSKLWKLLSTTLFVLWLGYLLRVVCALTETQYIDFQAEE